MLLLGGIEFKFSLCLSVVSVNSGLGCRGVDGISCSSPGLRFPLILLSLLVQYCDLYLFCCLFFTLPRLVYSFTLFVFYIFSLGSLRFFIYDC